MTEPLDPADSSIETRVLSQWTFCEDSPCPKELGRCIREMGIHIVAEGADDGTPILALEIHGGGTICFTIDAPFAAQMSEALLYPFIGYPGEGQGMLSTAFTVLHHYLDNYHPDTLSEATE